MNRKNTILVAVFMNAGLLAVLFLIALTPSKEVAVPSSPALVETPLIMPSFDEPPVPVTLAPPSPPLLLPEPEPLVHKLPPLLVEPPPAPVQPAIAMNEITVKKGDTLDKLAKGHGVSVDEIIKLNHLPSSFLKVGQVLRLPEKSSKSTAVAARSEGPEYYTVKVGDNVWAIANKHKMKPEELLRLNALNEEKARKLKAGDRLKVR